MTMNLYKKKILILGGKPIGSVDIVEYAKSLGCYTIVCDYLTKDASPAKQIADECWNYSTADVDDIVQRAKSEHVEAVFTGVHEFNINKSLEICRQLQLPFYATKENMELTSNKRIYKQIFKEFNIPVIPEYKISDIDDVNDDIHFPILMKPSDGSGAYGLQICNSKEDVLAKMEKSLAFSNKKEIIAEQYISDKEEITAVYIIKNGIPYLASVADRLLNHFDNKVIPLPAQYIWSSKYLPLWEQTIDDKMKKALQFMGLKNGMLFIQAIVKDEVIMPYDIGFRLSGTQEHIILEAVCGYNPLKLLTAYALTEKFGDETLVEKINPHFDCVASQITFLAKPATIARFEGLDEVSKLNGVIRIVKNKQEGETIPETAWGTLNQIVLRVFVKANTKDELNALIKQIRNSVRIYSTDNEDIAIKDKEHL